MTSKISTPESTIVPTGIHQLSAADALRSVGGKPEGLTQAEALQRLRSSGPNRIENPVRQPALLRLLKEFFQFFSNILWIAAALAFVADRADPGHGMARIGYALIVVIVVSGLFSFWQEYRVERTLTALRELLPRTAHAVRDGTVAEIAAEQLVVGDIVLLEQGENIPADCRLIEAFTIRVNNATVTGESAPRTLSIDPSKAGDLMLSPNILLAGTTIVSGRAKAVVFATGSHTEFGKIAHLTQAGGEATSPLRRQLAHLSRLIAALSVTIGCLFFAIGTLIGVPFWQDFIFSIGLIVAMVPEGLLPTLTLALVLAAERMAKRNVLVRHLTSVETLGSATVICTDKTGTLTQNSMRVRELLLADTPCTPAQLANDPDMIAEHQNFLLGARWCHDLQAVKQACETKIVGDPMEIALAGMAQAVLPVMPPSVRLYELSFDGDRMRQSVVHRNADGVVLFCKGAPETVVPLCTELSGRDHRMLDPEARQHVTRAQESMAERGLRVLAFASRKLPDHWSHSDLEREMTFEGLVGLEDPPRAEVADAISRCHAAGIKVIMITGDHPHTATAIAREIGLVQSAEPTVVTGEQLRDLSPAELSRALDAAETIFARVSADQKLKIVNALTERKHIVAVTGDGVNDAPALRSAHIGVAMGISGTDVAKEAADMVLLDDNFASIVNAVEEGRAVFQNIRKFLTYVLVHNVAELVPYLAFALFKIPLPLTPIQALCVDMGTDSLTALGLGVEKPDPHAMRRPPRLPGERLLNSPLALRAYLFLGLLEATAAMTAFFWVLFLGGWTYGTSLSLDDPLYLRATTGCLSAIIIMQIVNVYLCRSSVRSVFSARLLDNRLIIVGVGLELALLAVINYVPLANHLLDTAPVPHGVWLLLLPFAGGMLALEELRKWIVRRSLRRRRPAASRDQSRSGKPLSTALRS